MALKLREWQGENWSGTEKEENSFRVWREKVEDREGG